MLKSDDVVDVVVVAATVHTLTIMLMYIIVVVNKVHESLILIRVSGLESLKFDLH